MDQNEKQPEETPFRKFTAGLSRDSMILVAALAFLALAILLAVVFPPRNSRAPATGTTIAGGTSLASAPSAARATTGAPSPPTTPTGVSNETGATAVPSEPAGGYPAPQTPAGGGFSGNPFGPTGEELTPPAGELPTTGLSEEPSTSPSGAFIPPTAGLLPTFAPSRPTTGFPDLVATPGGSGFIPQPTPNPPRGSSLVTPTEQDDEEPTDTPEPTIPRAQPTTRPQTPPGPQPTTGGAAGGAPAPTRVPPAPINVLRGTIHWTAAQSPILLTRDQQLVAGAVLLVEPGVEVRLAPGVSFFVDGTLYALGKPDRPVRFVGSEGQRWNGLFGRTGSNIALEHTEIHGGGAGGTLLSSEGGNLVLHGAHVNDNGGHVQVSGSRLEMRDSEIAGNDMPYGAALDATYSSGGTVIITNNRIGGNRTALGAPAVRISSQSPFDAVNLDVQGNLLLNQDGPNLTLISNGSFQGSLKCNALLNGMEGLSIRSQAAQAPGLPLEVRDNAIEDHTPPIIPIYLKYGIGRGATSDVALDMRNNWWGSPLGPYHPDLHADGRGEAVGVNITFDPWLPARPACAPSP